MASQCVEGDIGNQLFYLERVSETPQLGRGERSYWPQRVYRLRSVTSSTSTQLYDKVCALPLDMIFPHLSAPPLFGGLQLAELVSQFYFPNTLKLC